MKFNFKIQQYQTDAVDAVVKVFNGQGFHDKTKFICDVGEMQTADVQMTFETTDGVVINFEQIIVVYSPDRVREVL